METSHALVRSGVTFSLDIIIDKKKNHYYKSGEIICLVEYDEIQKKKEQRIKKFKLKPPK